MTRRIDFLPLRQPHCSPIVLTDNDTTVGSYVTGFLKGVGAGTFTTIPAASDFKLVVLGGPEAVAFGAGAGRAGTTDAWIGAGYHGTVVTNSAGGRPTIPVERVQLGVRMEKRMVKELKGLAEFEGVTLGQLLEKIVLHSFEPAPGAEGELAASPHGKRALAVVADLKRIYEMDYEVHADKSFTEPGLP